MFFTRHNMKKFLPCIALVLIGVVIAVRGEQIFNAALRGYLALNGVQARFLHQGASKIFYFEGGEGNPETVILLHGVGGNALTSWFQLLPELAKKYHVIAPDMFFANLPDLVNSGYHVRSEEHLVKLMMDAKKPQRATLVGLSFGAWPALQTAIDFPHRVERLVLISPLDGTANTIVNNLDLDKTDAGRDFYHRIFASPPPVPSPFLWSHWDRTSRVFEALPSFRTQLEIEGRQLNSALSRVKCPVLVLHGQEDRIIPAERFRFMAGQIAKSSLISLEGSGHAVVWDQPEALLDSIESFLAEGEQ